MARGSFCVLGHFMLESGNNVWGKNFPVSGNFVDHLKLS